MSADLHTLLKQRSALTAWPLSRAVGLSLALHLALTLPFLLQRQTEAPKPEDLKVTWVTLPAQVGASGGSAPQEAGREGERLRRVEDVAPESGEKVQPMKVPEAGGTRETPTAKGSSKQTDAKGAAPVAAKGKAPSSATAVGAAGQGGGGGVGQGGGIPGLKASGGVQGATGLIGETDPAFGQSWYLSQVQGKIYGNWNRLNNATGRVGIRFRIYADGHVDGVRIETSSGDATFDRGAEMAVRRSVPLPPLPVDYTGGDARAYLPVLYWFTYLGN